MSIVRVHVWWLAVWAAAQLIPSAALAQRASAALSASRTSVAVGERFVLEARVDIEEGDLDDLQLPSLVEFDILGQRESRPYSFSFNFGQGAQSRSSVVHTYSLLARIPGTIQIDPVVAVVDGKTFRSSGLTIEVTGSAADPTDPVSGVPEPAAGAYGAGIAPDEVDPEVFVHAVADADHARIGQQVTVSFYLYTRTPLRSAPTTTQEPTTDGFWSHNLLPPSRQLTATVQRVEGRQYRVYLLHRIAVFPLTAGEHRIGPMGIELGAGGSIFDLLAGPGRSMKRSSKAIDIEVSALPPSVDSAQPWHVGELSVEWTASPKRVQVGDAVTLRATLKGTGNLKGLRLDDPVVPGFEVLEPTVHDDVTTTAGLVGGTRSFEWLALARTPGSHVAKAPEVQAIEPDSGTVTRVTAPQLSLEVLEGSGTAAAADGSGGGAADASESANGAEDRTDDPEGGVDLGTPRTQAELGTPRPPLDHSALYWLSLLALPALSLGSYLRGALERRRRARQQGNAEAMLGAKAQAALSRASGATDPLECLRLSRQAVLLALEAALGESAEALTFDALQRRMAERDQGELGRRVAQLLRDIEDARFVPGTSVAEARALSERCGPVVHALEGGTEEASS